MTNTISPIARTFKDALPAAVLLFSAATVSAQEQAPPPADQQQGPPTETVFDGDYLTVGIGAVVGSSYEGSDNYTVSPLPVVLGSFAGVDFQPRGPGVALDVIPDQDRAKIDFVLGPVVRARFDRNNSIEDDVVRSLGELDVAIELGGVAGVQVNRILHPFDSITAGVDFRWDVAGAHSGMVVFPNLTYFTPLSRGVAVSLSLSAEYVDDDYADYYFSITPAGSTASGLPTFAAEGGWKNVGATLFGGIDLDGDATNGGFGVIFIGSYSRLLEDAKRSPVTSIRGSADQFFGAVGIGYTF